MPVIMPVNLEYNNISPIHVWLLFITYNWMHSTFNVYAILNSIFSLDYRILLIMINVAGIYFFLRHARIDFTLRLIMNERINE
jgi:hypothetical protein